jgi:hypothetical protein
MIALINRHKNFLYTHEVNDFLLAMVIHTHPQVAHPIVRVPMFTRDTLLGVAVLTYRPTKVQYTDAKMFPGKELPQHEYRYSGRHSYAPARQEPAAEPGAVRSRDRVAGGHRAAKRSADRLRQDRPGAGGRDQKEDRAAGGSRPRDGQTV